MVHPISTRLLQSGLFSFILFCLAGLPVHAQWQQLSGLQGEPVYWTRPSAGKVFAITGNGGLSSSNNGTSWSEVTEFYQTNTVERLSCSGDTIVTFSYPDFYISTDDGATWSDIIAPGTTAQISDVLVHQNIILAATQGDYIYRSADAGATWTQVTTGLSTPFVNFLSASGSNIFAATEDGVFKSVSQGNSFTQAGLMGESVTRIHASGTYVFSYSTAGIHKSPDNGISWLPFQSVVPILEITDFCLSGNKVFAAAYDMLLVSDTVTNNWTPVTFNQNITFIFSVCLKGSTLFTGTSRGVFTSASQGASWTESNNGIIPVYIESLTVLNDTLYAGANIYGVSEYSGSGWQFTGLGLRNCSDIITRGTDLYTASDYGIYKSSNSGDTWTLINAITPPILVAYCTRVDVADSLIIGAALQNGIMRSGDYGVNWSYQATGLGGNFVSCAAISGGNIVVGTFSNGLYTSTDGGFTFNPSGATGQYIFDITTIGNNVLAASYGTGGNYLSTDNGVTFNAGPTNAFEDLCTAGGIILGSANSYIMVSLDSGQTFQNMVPAPGNVQIVGSHATLTDVYIGTATDGVWKTTISEILNNTEMTSHAYNAFLFPNAFHSESMIVIDDSWAKDEPDFYITDVSGRIVRKLKLTQARTVLPAGDLKSGMYLYTIQDDFGKRKTGKMQVF
jgi:photosystem II stability/assembly factor-like uncharacterized protein